MGIKDEFKYWTTRLVGWYTPEKKSEPVQSQPAPTPQQPKPATTFTPAPKPKRHHRGRRRSMAQIAYDNRVAALAKEKDLNIKNPTYTIPEVRPKSQPAITGRRIMITPRRPRIGR